jgi:hypothetical protein
VEEVYLGREDCMAIVIRAAQEVQHELTSVCHGCKCLIVAMADPEVQQYLHSQRQDQLGVVLAAADHNHCTFRSLAACTFLQRNSRCRLGML